MNAFKCPKCGISTWGNLKFCSKCGQKLDIECKECGWKTRHIYSETYNNCPKCGTVLSK